MNQKITVLLVITTFIYSSCARVGRPTGGIKDVLPPVTISASPSFNSVNFKDKKIKISFNEYIKLKDLNKQLVISPPMDFSPLISPMGYPSKYISIQIKDTLKENTTYTFNFGNAIIDNAEGNPLKRFKYLFSTGEFIDSSLVKGAIQDAFLQKTSHNITVMLYAADSTFYDSIIYKQKPNYITNTLDSITFLISNIKNGKYYLYALEDKNNNLLFNSKDEKIAFLKEPINVSSDSTFLLNLFHEVPNFSIKNVLQLSKNHIVIGYEGLLKAQVKTIIDQGKKTIDFVSYKDRKTDSIHIWYKNVDTDSINILIQKRDTIISKQIRLRSKKLDSLQLKKSVESTLHLNDSLYILSNTPIIKINKNFIKLQKKDSSEVRFRILHEKLNNRFLIDFNKEEKSVYSLTLFPNAITDFFGSKNDSLQFTLNTKKKEFYGSLSIILKGRGKTPLILQLLTEKGELLKTVFVEKKKQINFDLLKPRKYKIRIIYDANKNKRWDSGNVLNHRQPETIRYYPKTIEVRSNWSITEEFVIN